MSELLNPGVAVERRKDEFATASAADVLGAHGDAVPPEGTTSGFDVRRPDVAHVVLKSAQDVGTAEELGQHPRAAGAELRHTIDQRVDGAVGEARGTGASRGGIGKQKMIHPADAILCIEEAHG